jgi:sugar phosphate isomerase/epimerase
VKLAVREGMIPGTNLEERIAVVDRLGFDGIELHSPETMRRSAEELVATFDEQRVRPTTIDGVRKLLDPDPVERAASLTLLRERLDLCARLDAVAVLVVPIFGRALLPDLSPLRSAVELERDLFLAQLKDVADHAERTGARIAVEPLNRYETHFINTLDQGAELCRRVNRPGIRIMADFFHMSIEEADIAISIRQSAPYIQYVHVADSNRKQPGRGHLDFRSGFRALKNAGYDGYLGVECGLIGSTEDALREAAIVLRKAWAEA